MLCTSSCSCSLLCTSICICSASPIWIPLDFWISKFRWRNRWLNAKLWKVIYLLTCLFEVQYLSYSCAASRLLIFILDGDFFELPIINAHPKSTILLFHKKYRRPQGDMLRRMNPLSNNSWICIFNSLSSSGAILYSALDIRAAPGIRSIKNSISLSGGSPRKSYGKTSRNSCTTVISSIFLSSWGNSFKHAR